MKGKKNNGNGLDITELPITIRCKIECTRNNPSLSRFDNVLSPRAPALVRPIGYFRNTHFVDLYVFLVTFQRFYSSFDPYDPANPVRPHA